MASVYVIEESFDGVEWKPFSLKQYPTRQRAEQTYVWRIQPGSREYRIAEYVRKEEAC